MRGTSTETRGTWHTPKGEPERCWLTRSHKYNGELTTLVPRLTCRTLVLALSAAVVVLKDAWKAVYICQLIVYAKGRNIHTGSNKLMTLKLKRQALICVTVLL